MGSNEHVIRSNGISLARQVMTYFPVMAVGRRFQWQDFQGGENEIDSICQFPGTCFVGAVTEFGCDDYARADTLFSCRLDFACYSALGVADQIGENIGVQ